MLRILNFVVWCAHKLLGLSDPSAAWKWIGSEGNPMWSRTFWFDGFNYQSIVVPSLARPSTVGCFQSFSVLGSIDAGGGMFYVPAMMLHARREELIQGGLTQSQADRAVRRELRKEIALTQEYEAGLWKPYKLTVMVKRGRSILASHSIDGLKIDPHRLMMGEEVFVSETAWQLRKQLRDSALLQLKQMKTQGALALH